MSDRRITCPDCGDDVYSDCLCSCKIAGVGARRAAQPSILEEAGSLVNGDRAVSYGDPAALYGMVAQVMTTLGVPMTTVDAIVFNKVQKLCRQRITPKRDNLVDDAGYTELQARVEGL